WHEKSEKNVKFSEILDCVENFCSEYFAPAFDPKDFSKININSYIKNERYDYRFRSENRRCARPEPAGISSGR
ncbi:MAG: hypothetical protein IJW39_03070, partial [Opitutales bacterium]|nr:hypothetical protein [Opitutales bacterium]